MATVARGKKPDKDPIQETPKPARKGRGGRTAFLAALLLALVVLAPTIATRTPLRDTCLVLACRIAGVDGNVRAGDLSLGWLSPVSATQVEIDDSQGNLLLSLAKVDCDKTLLDLLLHHADLGHTKLEGVKAEVTFTDTGSNVEEVLAAWLAPRTSAASIVCELELTDAQASIHDTASKRDWQLEKIELHLKLSADAAPIEVDLAAVVAGEGADGRIALKYPPTAAAAPDGTQPDATKPAGPSRGEIVLEADSLPLALVQPLVRRIVPGCELAGRLAAQIGWQRDENDGFKTDGVLTVAGWQLAAPGCAPWTEEKLDMTLSAAGTLAGATVKSVENAVAETTVTAGRFDLRLVKPIEQPSAETAWPIAVGFEGDLATWVARFVPAAATRDGWRVAGRLQVAGDVQYSKQSTSGGIELTVDDLVVTPPHAQPGGAQKVKLTANGVYEPGADTVQIAKFELDSAVIRASGKGQFDQLRDKPSVRLEGQVDYDLQQADQWLRPYFGESLQLTGREAQPFSLAGPLPIAGEDPLAWLAQCTAKVDVGWQTASFHGFAVGQGRIEAELADGMVRVAPFDLPVSEGQVHLAPQLHLSPAPAVLTHDPGRIVDSVVITPEMCNAGMRYAMPILAGVTHAQGRFSVDLADCKLPLADVVVGSAAGRITIHSVELGPGLLVRAFGPVLETLHEVFRAGATDPLAGVNIARECPVDYRLVNGRVYHRGLVLEFPSVTVSTYGSVGLDETLAIMAELTLPEKWTANHPLGAALTSKPLQIPIGGTLKRPQIDGREVERLTGRAVKDVAQDVIHNDLGRELRQGLDHLFGPPQ